jgi:hypothetical protein
VFKWKIEPEVPNPSINAFRIPFAYLAPFFVLDLVIWLSQSLLVAKGGEA